MALFGAADCGAAALRDYLTGRGLTGGQGREQYYTSGSAEEFSRAAALFLGRPLAGEVEQLPVMEAEE